MRPGLTPEGLGGGAGAGNDGEGAGELVGGRPPRLDDL